MITHKKFDSFVMTSKSDSACCLHSDDYVCTLLSQDGTTPLHIASEKGHSQVAELLLSKGAGVNLPKKVLLFSRYFSYGDVPLVFESLGVLALHWLFACFVNYGANRGRYDTLHAVWRIIHEALAIMVHMGIISIQKLI